MKVSFFKLVCIAILLFSLIGCTSKRQELIKQGHSISYADGFQDGFHSGKGSAANLLNHYTRDAKRFDQDAKYAEGWNAGFADGELEQQRLNENLSKQELAERKKRYEYRERTNMERDAVRGTEMGSIDNFGE